jgi:hypothetical protein
MRESELPINVPSPAVASTTKVPSGLSCEDQLVLLLARGELALHHQTRIPELLATPLQWPAILERAKIHQVSPLLYRNLRNLGFANVPAEVLAELRVLYLANALRNQLLAEESARLLGLLNTAGIRVIPLKGVALASSLYGDAAARICADIDIMVPIADLARAMEFILASGYRAQDFDPFFSKLVLRHGRHHEVTREGTGISYRLEVHWKLIQHSSKDDEAVRALWAEARQQNVFGVPAFSLSPEWQFLYLCLHAAHHDWQTLKWIADIHQVISFVPVDWEEAMAQAKRLQLDHVIRQTAAVCSLLLGTQIPEGVHPAILPQRSHIFPKDPVMEDSPAATLAFRHLRVLTRPLDKLRYIATAIFAPKATDRDALRLPPPLGFLYYAIRPARLLFKWIGGGKRS